MKVKECRSSYTMEETYRLENLKWRNECYEIRQRNDSSCQGIEKVVGDEAIRNEQIRQFTITALHKNVSVMFMFWTSSSEPQGFLYLRNGKFYYIMQ